MQDAEIREIISAKSDPGLRPFIEAMSFTLTTQCWCGGALEYWSPEFELYLNCVSCGCKAVRFKPTLESLQRFYTSMYWYEYQTLHKRPSVDERYEGDMHDRIPQYIAWIKEIAPPPCNLLEIGSGNGRLLYELKQAGYDSVGVEMDKNLAEHVTKKTGVTVHHGEFPPGASQAYGIIVVIDVLEHVPDQIAFVQNIKSRLTEGGKVLVHCPVLDTMEASVDLRDAFNPLSHLWIHNSRSFAKLWQTVGLPVARLGEIFKMPIYRVGKI
ncbi:MAG: class I SAM-dependent methyltransferase [Candidatus Magnetominusculus sp. LBB02]|nr:class I SAM-dependent methyltransferase [Candidatus Magnetominusculus sp. LBB02]